MIRNRLALVFCLSLIPFTVFSQQATTQSPQGVALATQAIVALTGTTQINDITLTGTATRTAGSDIESGNVVLKALGIYESRTDLSAGNGTLSEIFNLSTGVPQGFWIGLDGTVHPMASHNCMTGVVWFFPALSILSQVSNPNVSTSYIGQEALNGQSVQHIRLVLQNANLSAADNQMLGQLSTTDVFLDPSSHLPVALTFSVHPDDDQSTNIPIQIIFSNYQVVNGVQVPFRIQKFMNGTLFLDLTIQAANVNSGLTDSTFSVN
jgi:hypothetical protein